MQGDIDYVDLTVDLLFFVDLVLSFFSAVKLQDGTMIKEFHAISKTYLKTWFVVDLLAIFPFYLIGQDSISALAPILRIPRLFKMLRLVRLVKMLRYVWLQISFFLFVVCGLYDCFDLQIEKHIKVK